MNALHLPGKWKHSLQETNTELFWIIV